MSLTLERLRHRVAASQDESSRLYALTRLCIELAQLGRSIEAREVMSSLRLSGSAQVSDLLAINLVLIDGLCLYYDGLKTQSIDRLTRAHALACASQNRRLIGESGAWLALVAYSFDNLAVLERSLVNAAECIDAMEPSIAARVFATVADLFQLAGSMSEASVWYSRARNFSRVEQDDAVLVAIEFNRLAAGLTRLKYNEFLNCESLDKCVREWEIEIASVELLHKAYRSDSLRCLLILCDARNKYFSDNIPAAVKALKSLYDQGLWSEVGLSRETLLSELTWCRVLSGSAESIGELDFPSIDDIDRLSPSMKIDCLFYASKIGRRLFSAVQLDQITQMLDDARAALAAQVDTFQRLASRVASLEKMQSMQIATD